MANRPRSLSTGDAMRVRSLIPRQMQPYRELFQAERSKEAINTFLLNLPRLTEKDLVSMNEADSSCPICLNSLLTIVTEEEMALAMDSPATPVQSLGVTKLETCGHIFCRKDIVNWFEQGRNTCPSCRHPLIPGLAADPHPLEFEDEFANVHDLENGVIQAVGAIPLTPEQVSSLRSAIMLLTEGDGVGRRPFSAMTELPGSVLADAASHDAAHGGRRNNDDDDRHAFGGMYS